MGYIPGYQGYIHQKIGNGQAGQPFMYCGMQNYVVEMDSYKFETLLYFVTLFVYIFGFSSCLAKTNVRRIC